MTWRLIEEDTREVYQNLAIDEAIARCTANHEKKTNTLRFWRSERSVVIGRFQCVHKEVNLAYCEEEKIRVARRFTGGGAVYHDPGNLNFSFCVSRTEAYVPRNLKDIYEVFIGSVVGALQSLNIPATYDPVRSCIRINDLKITGTAGWLKRGVAFLHGTLLINSNLQMLRQSLTPPEGQQVFLRDRTRVRCMDSKRDNVTNVADQVKTCPKVDAIKSAITDSIKTISGKGVEDSALSRDERDTAQVLYQSRYSQSEWNLGTPTQ